MFFFTRQDEKRAYENATYPALQAKAAFCVYPNGEETMPFNIKRRGKLTYYYEGDAPVLSNLVVEAQPDGDLKLYFSGLTGGTSAAGILGRDEVVTMDPEREIPLVFQCWELWLREAGICQSIADVDFVEIHAFRAQPKSPNPVADPAGYAGELERLRSAYARAYADFSTQRCP